MSLDEFSFTLSSAYSQPFEFTFGLVPFGDDEGKWTWSICLKGHSTIESKAFSSVCEAQADAITYFRSLGQQGTPQEWASYFREQSAVEKRWNAREAV